MRNDGDGLSVAWWWTPDCGAIHTEWNPVALDLLHCPSPPDWDDSAEADA